MLIDSHILSFLVLLQQQHHHQSFTYSTLHRVIDVLGLQVIEDNSNSSYGRDLEKNPAYRNLKAQQEIVNGAIEHMAVM
jgi:hypothetical protein